MTRNGKIARLSVELREELNERLEEGQEGKELVKWLNSLPEVQNLIRYSFRGQPISEQNLSQWKQGGYRDWQEKLERWHMLHQLKEEAKEMGFAVDPEETQRHLSVMLTLELARAVQDIKEKTPDAMERLQRLEPVIGKFVQLRREESNARRVEMAWRLHKHELRDDGAGGFGLESALRELESEADEVGSEASAPDEANGNGVKVKSPVSAGAVKKSRKKREPSKGRSRPARKTRSNQIKAKENGKLDGESRESDLQQAAQGSSTGATASEAGQPSGSNASGSHPIKVDHSSPVSNGECGETKGLAGNSGNEEKTVHRGMGNGAAGDDGGGFKNKSD